MAVSDVVSLTWVFSQSGSGDSLREPLAAFRGHLNVGGANPDACRANDRVVAEVPGPSIEQKVFDNVPDPLTHRFSMGLGKAFESFGAVEDLLVEGMKLGELQSLITKRVDFAIAIQQVEERYCD